MKGLTATKGNLSRGSFKKALIEECRYNFYGIFYAHPNPDNFSLRSCETESNR